MQVQAAVGGVKFKGDTVEHVPRLRGYVESYFVKLCCIMTAVEAMLHIFNHKKKKTLNMSRIIFSFIHLKKK